VLEAAALFPGRHDFASLASTGSDVRTTVRTVIRSEARFAGGTLVYEVEADGFLRKMVRSMMGGLLAAGTGQRTVPSLHEALLARDRSLWPAPAPGCGLYLVSVRYAEGDATR
jgi:tRNA pseudouridine38-40 synthase